MSCLETSWKAFRIAAYKIDHAVWLAATLSFLLATPSLGSTVAFSAATSIATIGLYISYGLPILIAVFNPSQFNKGPFNLGRFSRIIGTIACLWIGFITIIFCLPTQNPVTDQTLNYTPVAVGIILFGALSSWFLSARKWFSGPIRMVDADDDRGQVRVIEGPDDQTVVLENGDRKNL